MSRKTKAMEAQIAQFTVENAELKTQVSALELELSACRDELSNTALELANARRRLDDFRARQEEIIAALTEAHNTRERIIMNAKQKASEIVAEANAKKQAVLTEASETLAEAKLNAENIFSKASADAEIAVGTANKKADGIVEAATLQSKKLLKDAKLKSEELTEAVELRISERRSELDSLTVTLHEKASLALDQTKVYAELLNMIADCECIKALAETDGDSETEPENARREGTEPENARREEAEPENARREEMKPENARREEAEPETENEENAGKEIERETEFPETGCSEAEDIIQENAESAEASAGHTDAETETPAKNEILSAENLPAEYADAASLMKNIYALEGRKLPEEVSQRNGAQSGDGKIDEASALASENETAAPAGNAEEEPAIPVDPELNVILNELMDILNG